MLISILDGSEPLEDVACRPAILPDGRKGAIWRGLAYPLLESGDAIDVTARGWPPSQCRTNPLAAPRSSYMLLEGVEAKYVLISGSVAERDAMAADLSKSGIAVLRVGRYLPETQEGFQGDWYVKVPANTDNEKILQRFGDGSNAPSTSAEGPSELRIHLLKVELATALARGAAERAELTRLRLEYASFRQDTVAERRALQEVADAAALEAKNLAEALEQLSRNSEIRSDKNEALPIARQQSSNRTKAKIVDEIRDVISTLFPRAKLVRDTIDVISVEFLNRRSVYKALNELHTSQAGIPAAWKTLKGHDGWLERHVSDGQSDAGRAYARLVDPDRSWEILISHKGEQTRDMQWLSKQ